MATYRRCCITQTPVDDASSDGDYVQYRCGKCDQRMWLSESKNPPQCCRRAARLCSFKETVGLGKFKCRCGNRFVGVTSGRDTSTCYRCGRDVSPSTIVPKRAIQRKSAKRHECTSCNGKGRCPNYLVDAKVL